MLKRTEKHENTEQLQDIQPSEYTTSYDNKTQVMLGG